jgi:tetratricopeptide (TPR) repeat protein
MTVAEQSIPPKRPAPRKPRRRKAPAPPRTLADAIFRLIGPLWNKWYGVPIILLVLSTAWVWHTLNDAEHRAFVSYLTSLPANMLAPSYDVVIDDLDTTTVNEAGAAHLSIFRPLAIQLQRAFDGTRHTTFVCEQGKSAKAKYSIKPLLVLDGTTATVTLELQDAQGGLVNTSQMTGQVEFFEKVGGALGPALLHDLDFDRYTLTRTRPLARHKAKPEAYALFLAAQDLESKNVRARPQAIELMREAIERDKDFATGFGYLAALLKREGKTDEAAAQERHANELDPDHPVIDDSQRNPVPHLLDASDKVHWEPLTEAIELKVVDDRDYDIHLIAWRIDPKGVTLKLALEQDSYGDTAQKIRMQENAILAVNAGFFDRDSDNHLNPTYALRVSGTIINPYRGETAGGALAIDDSGAHILTPQLIEANWDHARDLVYSKPLMLEPGRKFAMLYNDYDRRSRTAVCTTSDGKLIVLVVNGGVSLFELAEFLRDRDGRQGLPCDAALALTGGPATQASFSLGERAIDIQGSWPVYDALVVTPRAIQH